MTGDIAVKTFKPGDIIQNLVCEEKLYLVVGYRDKLEGYVVQTIEGRRTFWRGAINTFYVKVGEI